ncbi:hypothetical protein [Roseospira navarrensis]|uniref:Lipoprotein n=1 Tax=Roseospira navarrensis TaxID=140058 RepID=A0A7X1ZCZ8_9PROT|nr:hypothetical protein [Roseospira navarrensis]MQX35749.1 hypothetical protein [Roseospira navarrensis]
MPTPSPGSCSRFTRPILGVGAAVAAALALAACAGPRTVSHVSSLNDVFKYLPVSGLPLDVVGNPFPQAADAFVRAAAADGLSGNVNGRPLAFVPAPDRFGPDHPGYRMVLFLSGGGIVAGQALCEAGLPTDSPKGGTLHASAALCNGTKMIAWGEGWGGPVPAQPDVAFLALMDQLANAVFKRERDRDRDPTEWPET